MSCDELRARMNARQQELFDARIRRDSVVKRLAQRQRELEAERAKPSPNPAVISDLKGKIRSLEGQFAALRTTIADLQGKVRSLETQWRERCAARPSDPVPAPPPPPPPSDIEAGADLPMDSVDDRVLEAGLPVCRITEPRAGFSGQIGRIITTVAGHGSRPLGNWQSDNAVDIALPWGTPILAAFDGVISPPGTAFSGYGNQTTSGNLAGCRLHLRASDRAAFYGHLSLITRLQNTRVRRGEKIGESGQANLSPHLHFAMTPPFNPASFAVLTFSRDPFLDPALDLPPIEAPPLATSIEGGWERMTRVLGVVLPNAGARMRKIAAAQRGRIRS